MKAKTTPRERVLDTASRLFYEQGYHATGINQIIAEADVAKASLYQLFRSKDELLLEYLEQQTRAWWADFETFRAAAPEGKKTLLALLDYRMHLIRDHRYRGCGFMRIAYELPELDGAPLAVIRDFKQGVKTFIGAQIKTHLPQLGRQETVDLIELVTNLYEGSGSQAYVQRSSKPIEEAKRLLHKFIP